MFVHPESTGCLGGGGGGKVQADVLAQLTVDNAPPPGSGVYVHYWSGQLTPQPGSVIVSQLEMFRNCFWRNCHTLSRLLFPPTILATCTADRPHEKHTIVVQSLRVEIGLKRGTTIGVSGGNGRRGPISLM